MFTAVVACRERRAFARNERNDGISFQRISYGLRANVMRDFFRSGWRKSGAATVLMAGLLIIWCVRSFSYQDTIRLPLDTEDGVMLVSVDGICGGYLCPINEDFFKFPLWEINDPGNSEYWLEVGNAELNLRWGSFSFYYDEEAETLYCFAPYWSVILSLILLTTWLWLPRH